MELKRDINKEHHEHHEIMMMNLKVVDVSTKDSLICLTYFINNIKYLHFLQILFSFYFILIGFYQFTFFFNLMDICFNLIHIVTTLRHSAHFGFI